MDTGLMLDIILLEMISCCMLLKLIFIPVYVDDDIDIWISYFASTFSSFHVKQIYNFPSNIICIISSQQQSVG